MAKDKFSLFSLVTTAVIVSLVLVWPRSNYKIIFCDVGQGDAILIVSGWYQVLVDTGPDGAVLTCLEEYMPWFDSSLDLVVLTHPDKDHIGGFLDVAARYTLEEVWVQPWGKDSALWSQVWSEVRKLAEKQTVVHFPDGSTRTQIGQNLKIQVVHPSRSIEGYSLSSAMLSETVLSDKTSPSSEIANGENDDSIALNIEFFWVDVFLGGDLSKQTELSLINAGLIKDVDILKALHHGSKSSNSLEIFTATLPEYFVVSAGKDNSYGHPEREVINRAVEIGSQVLQTSQRGHVVFSLK